MCLVTGRSCFTRDYIQGCWMMARGPFQRRHNAPRCDKNIRKILLVCTFCTSYHTVITLHPGPRYKGKKERFLASGGATVQLITSNVLATVSKRKFSHPADGCHSNRKVYTCVDSENSDRERNRNE